MERPRVVGITRIRNEAEVIEDTLRHAEALCDGLIVYDDCSTDGTPELVERNARKLLGLVRGERWRAERTEEETRHRKLLLERAQAFSPEWVLCLDADERYELGLRDYLLSDAAREVDGVRVRFFDAYLTPDHRRPYAPGEPLEGLERLYGPECREILVAWRNSPLFYYEGLDAREPVAGPGARIAFSPFRCKHFGKGISERQWEETCEYYARFFPEPYTTKWNNRRGKALHTASDFGTPLYAWEEVDRHAVRIHPL